MIPNSLGFVFATSSFAKAMFLSPLNLSEATSNIGNSFLHATITERITRLKIFQSKSANKGFKNDITFSKNMKDKQLKL